MTTTTILFTDIEGSSALVEQLGDRRWLEVLRAHNAIVREQVESYRGFEVKTVGDGFMVAFPEPDPALACAVAIQRALSDAPLEPPLRVRMGLHAGTALEEEGDFYGRDVNMAARVAAQARGGEILVSDVVRETAAGVALAPPRVVKLKGLAGTHRVYPVAWDGTAPDPLVPPQPVAAPGALEEREAAQARIRGALEEAAAGTGTLIALTGPPGLGKSTLLGHLGQEAAAAGFPVLQAVGSEVERPFTFGVVRQLFEATAERRAPLLEPAAAQALGLAAPVAGDWRTADGLAYQAYGALNRLVAGLSEESPLVLVVDDVHWADDASLAWLGFLQRRLRALPVLVAVGSRDGESDAAHLAALLAAAEAITLEPLSLQAVTRLVQAEEPGAAAEFAAACHRASGGVPLYVRELLAAARTAGLRPDREGARRLPGVTSESVRRLVLNRLEPLGEPALRLARACAALDSRADIRAAGRLAGLAPPDALAAADRLCDRGVFRARRPLGFQHPIMRAAVLAETPVAERSRLHHAAADLLAEERAPAQEIAAHVLATEPQEDPRAVRRLREGAAAALAAGAPASAAAFLERALLEPPAPGDLGAVLHETARAAVMAGDSGRALALASRALAALEDRVARGHAMVVLARALEGEFQRPGSTLEWEADVRPVLGELRALAASLPDAERALRYELEALGINLVFLRLTLLSEPMEPAEAERLRALAAAASGRSAGEREILGVRAAWAAVTATATAAEVLDLCRRSLEDGTVARELGAGGTSDSAIEALMTCDAHAEAERHLAEAARYARRFGVPAPAALIAAYRCDAAWLAGDLQAALDHAADAGAHLREAGPDAYVSAIVRGATVGTLLMRGELAAAESTARAIEHPRLQRHALGLVAAARGRHDLAVEHLRAAQATFDRRGVWRSGGPLRPVRPDLAISLAALGETGEARRVLAAELEVARRFGAPSCLAEALRAQAIVERSRAPLQEAAEVIRGSEARLVEARVLLALGDPRGAALADRCGALGLIGPPAGLAS